MHNIWKSITFKKSLEIWKKTSSRYLWRVMWRHVMWTFRTIFVGNFTMHLYHSMDRCTLQENLDSRFFSIYYIDVNCKIYQISKFFACIRLQLHLLCTNLQYFCTTIQLFWKLLFHQICNIFAIGLINRFTFSKILHLFTIFFKVNSKIRLHILLYWSAKIL